MKSKEKCKVVGILVQKGGVGKSTTTCILAQAAATRGKKVLVIDLEPQGNLSFAMGAKTQRADYTSIDLLENRKPFEPQTVGKNIDIVPASEEVADIKSKKGSDLRLREAIEPLKRKYDAIFIDTTPKKGELQFNVLQCATDIIMPINPDIFNLQALYQTIDTMEPFKKSNTSLKAKGFIFTRPDNVSTLAKAMKEKIIIEANRRGVPYLGSVRQGIAVQEAIAQQISIYEYAPKSKPALDYMAVYETLFL